MIYLRLLINYLIVAIFYIPEFTRRCFGYVDIDQLSFFLFTENGTLGTDPQVLDAFFQWVILRPLLLVLVFYGIYHFLLKSKLSPLRLKLVYNILLPVLLVSGLVHNFLTYDGLNFAKRFSGKDLLENYFHNLPTTMPTIQKNKNLILLYVESLENTFSNDKIFDRNLNQPLEEKLGKSLFSIKQAPGTGWTTAGMVSSQCGMPIASFMGNSLGRRDAPVFSNLTCISDILADYGYQQTFFVGPDLKFSGMDKFYLEHGFQEAYGKDELFKKLDKQEFGTGWGGGPNDDIVLDAALEKIKINQKDQRNFNVTIITTDNHAPDGILSPRCKTENLDTKLAEVVLCTNRAIKTFIERLEEINVFENTVLVVMGDHKFMGDLGTSERDIYFNYYGANTKQLEATIFELTHFDVFPTLLRLILNIEVDQAHLGHSIFSKNLSGYKELREYIFGNEFLKFSQFYRSFWQKNTIE